MAFSILLHLLSILTLTVFPEYSEISFFFFLSPHARSYNQCANSYTLRSVRLGDQSRSGSTAAHTLSNSATSTHSINYWAVT